MCSSFSFSLLSHHLTPLPPTTLSEIAVFHWSSSWHAFLICFPFSSETLAGGQEHTHTLPPFQGSFPWRLFLTHIRDLYVKNRTHSNTLRFSSFGELLAWTIDRFLISAPESELKQMKRFYYTSSWDVLVVFGRCCLERFTDFHPADLPVQENLVFPVARNWVLGAGS